MSHEFNLLSQAKRYLRIGSKSEGQRKSRQQASPRSSANRCSGYGYAGFGRCPQLVAPYIGSYVETEWYGKGKQGQETDEKILSQTC